MIILCLAVKTLDTHLTSLESTIVDGQQERTLLLQDMNDEDIQCYIHDVIALDVDCQYERFAHLRGQRHPVSLDQVPVLGPTVLRRSVRLSEQALRDRHNRNCEHDAEYNCEDQSS